MNYQANPIDIVIINAHIFILRKAISLGAMLAQLPLSIVLPMVVFVDNNPSGERFTLVGIVLGAISFIAFMLLYKLSVGKGQASSR